MYQEITRDAFDRAAALFARINEIRESLPTLETMAAKIAARNEIKRLIAERRAILNIE